MQTYYDFSETISLKIKYSFPGTPGKKAFPSIFQVLEVALALTLGLFSLFSMLAVVNHYFLIP